MHTTSTYRRRMLRTGETFVRRFMRVLGERVDRFRASPQPRQSIAKVADLSDFHLHDIGLTREAVRIAELTGRLPGAMEEALTRQSR